MSILQEKTVREFDYDYDVVYTNETANMTGLPDWHPSEPDDNECFKAYMISLGLLLTTLFLPTMIVFIVSRYKRECKLQTAIKSVTEELVLLDHIFDPDGHYRESVFDGMLSEDAADDVEIPAKSKKENGSSWDTLNLERKSIALPKMKHASTQTDELLAYGAAKIAFKKKEAAIFCSSLKRTMDSTDEFNTLEEFVNSTGDQQQNRTTRQSQQKLSLKPTQRETQRQHKRAKKKTPSKEECIDKKDETNRQKEFAFKNQVAKTQEAVTPKRKSSTQAERVKTAEKDKDPNE